MKISFFILLFALFTSQAFKAGNNCRALPVEGPGGDSTAIAISDAKLDVAKRGLAAGAIRSMTGVSYVTYCSNHAVYLLYINRKVYPSPSDFLNQAIQNTGLTDLYLKSGNNPMPLLNDCQMSPFNSESIKRSYDK